MGLRRKIIIYLTTLLLILFVGSCVVVNAEEEIEENPIVAEQDTLKESMEYYAKVLIEYIGALGGTITGLLIILFRIKKILKEVKDGTKSVETAKEELALERKNLEASKEEFTNATKKLAESIKNQEELDKLSVSIDRIIESLRIMVSNDSKLVSSGVARKIDRVLSDVEQEETNYDKQGEIRSV